MIDDLIESPMLWTLASAWVLSAATNTSFWLILLGVFLLYCGVRTGDD